MARHNLYTRTRQRKRYAEGKKGMHTPGVSDAYSIGPYHSIYHNMIRHFDNLPFFAAIRKLKRSLSGYLTYKKSNVLDPYIGLVVDLVEEHPGLYQSMKLWASDEEFGRLVGPACIMIFYH